MTTEQKIAAIIEDCCAIDPSFRGREAELRPLIKRLLSSQPETRFDDAFAKKLRDAVLAQAVAGVSSAAKPSIWERLRHLKRDDVFVLGGAALGLTLAVGLAISSFVSVPKGGVQLAAVPRSTSFDSAASPPRAAVTSLAAGAFGTLTSGDAPGLAPSGTAAAFGRGGGGGVAAPAAQPVAAEGKIGAMPIYRPVNYRFTYKGEIAVPGTEVDVYRRVKGFAAGSAPLAALAKTAAGAADLTRLDGAMLQNFTLTENRDFGYTVTVDAGEGIVSFGQDWRRWPHPENQCQDETCMKRYRLTADQMPSDDAVVGVAERFLQEYGISRDHFGTPEVRSEWKGVLAAAADKTDVYLPDSVTVVYPLMLDGKVANDNDGASMGLTVSVSVRHLRVDGLWGLNTNAYERSTYPAETDVKRLRSFVERGGIWGGWNNDAETKSVDVELGDPEPVLAQSWKPRGDGTSDELYVPALRFPVLNPPADQPWFRHAVIVPLVKEVLDAATQPGQVPVPTPFIMNK